MSSSLLIRKETDTLAALVNNVTVKSIILDDQFIEDKLRYVLSRKDFILYASELKSLFVSFYNDFVNSIANKQIFSKTIIIPNRDSYTEYNKLDRYFPLFGYYITFNVYEDVCISNRLSLEQIFVHLNSLKKKIFKSFEKYNIINYCDYFNIHVYKNISNTDSCYISFEINFDFKDFLDMILLIDLLKITQKL